jgi:hypothetical protein
MKNFNTQLLINQFRDAGLTKAQAVTALKKHFGFKTMKDIEIHLMVRGAKAIKSIVEETLNAIYK